jgi:hypothetical protein
MPPLLIALATVALYFLIPRSQRGGGMTVIQTPTNTPTGITTGFVQPTGQAGGSPVPSTGIANAPGTGQSGVPQSSPQAQRYVPSAQTSPQEFYSYPNVFGPQYVPTRVTGSPASSGGCGCGGHASTPKPQSDCSISVSRATNSGCLAPTTRSLFTPATQPIFDSWLANVASEPDSTAFTAWRASQQAQQDQSPLNENDNAPAVGFISPHIGIRPQPRVGRVA